jgi:hypothetical protein
VTASSTVALKQTKDVATFSIQDHLYRHVNFPIVAVPVLDVPLKVQIERPRASARSALSLTLLDRGS